MSPQEELMKEKLEQMGIQIRTQHFTGDSSYPTEITLRYSFVNAMGPTLDLALLALTEKLLKFVDVENA